MSQPYVGEIILVGFNFPPAGWAFCDGSLLPVAENDTLFTLIGTAFGGDGVTTFALPDLRGRIPIGTGPAGQSTYNLGDTGGVETITLTSAQMPSHNHANALSGLTAAAMCRDAAGNQLTPVGNVPAIGPFVPFTDDPLAAESTAIKAAHIIELRSRIDTLRAGVGLGPYPYNADPTLTVGTTLIRAQHVLDLRAAINEAYTALNRPLPTYTDPGLSPGATPRVAHIAEIRSALIAAPPGIAPTHSNAPPDANMNPAALTVGDTLIAANAGGDQPHDNRQPSLTLNFCISLFGVFPSQA